MSISAAPSLYSRDILRLAMSLPHKDRIDAPFYSATRRAPVCGSEMTVDVAVRGGRVSAVAIRATACALGQASAAILRDNAIGRTTGEMALLAKRVAQALKGQAEMPSAFQALTYARDYPARHGAILLPLDTLLAALADEQA